MRFLLVLITAHFARFCIIRINFTALCNTKCNTIYFSYSALFIYSCISSVILPAWLTPSLSQAFRNSSTTSFFNLYDFEIYLPFPGIFSMLSFVVQDFPLASFSSFIMHTTFNTLLIILVKIVAPSKRSIPFFTAMQHKQKNVIHVLTIIIFFIDIFLQMI